MIKVAFTLYELVRWFSVNVKAFESRVIAFESCVIAFESRVIAYVTQVFKQCVGILGRVCFFFSMSYASYIRPRTINTRELLGSANKKNC